MSAKRVEHVRSAAKLSVTFALVAVVVIVLQTQDAFSEPPVKHGASVTSVDTAQEALARARHILGISKAAGLRMTAQRRTIQKDKTPYLSRELLGRDLWVVDLHDWSIKLPSSAGTKDSLLRRVTLYVIPETGVVVKVKLHWPEGVPPLPPIVGAEVAAAQMGGGLEVYHGFPDHAPTISLEKALDSIYLRGFDPMEAKEIIAEYVVWSRLSRDPRPVWAVMLRGVSVIKPRPGTPAGALDQYRHIVDAETGEWLFLNNLPRWEASKTPGAE